ncbi:MAG: hypothetical protein NT087_12080 [Deltaproteobacteria bacterium]|nr:hypothetical protein [Deltaproteobacteria bacterium]
MIEENLLFSLQELLEASEIMMHGQPPSVNQVERYHRARESAQRLISRAEKSRALK